MRLGEYMNCYDCKLDVICNRPKLFDEKCTLWKPKEQCNTCKYHYQTDCRKNAPIALKKCPYRKWPSVEYNSWCGDWEVKDDR